MTVGEMVRRMSSAELTEWLALYLVEADERMEADLDREARAGVEATKRKSRAR